MTDGRLTWLLCSLLLVCSAFGERAARLTSIDGFPCAADRVIIKIDRAGFARARQSTSSLTNAELAWLLNLPDGVVIENSAFSRLMRSRGENPDDTEIVPPAPGSGLAQGLPLDARSHLVLKLNRRLGLREALGLLKNHPLLEYAEPDGIGYGGATTPSDPDYGYQWHHPKIESPDAWDMTQGTSSVTVAVLDTGLNTGLSEFSGRSVAGYDFVNGDGDPADDHGHGTSVAGVVGANANNATLVAGVDWNGKIMPVKVLNSGNWGYYSDWADGVNYAVANGADVINLSAGGSGTSSALVSAITNAVAQGVIFVTITHNDGVGTITFPGTLAETITVGATETNDVKTSFSNWGPEIDLVAPGRDIYTVSRYGNLTSRWGTSFSAPQVAGVAALLAGLRPGIDNEEARTLLCAGAGDQVGDALDTPGFDNYYGWGRLNAYNTLLLAYSEIEIGMTSNTTVLSWAAPANAGNKQPYTVESRSDVSSGNWFSLPESNMTYSATQVTYAVSGSTNAKSFYRYGVSVE